MADIDGMEYSPVNFADLDLSVFRERFPTETSVLNDQEIWDVVAEQDDDRDDDEWRELFKQAYLNRAA